MVSAMAWYLSALYPQGSEERRSVEGASFCTSSGDTASRPYGPPALRWGALNAGKAWVLGSERMKGIEADDKCFHFIACSKRTRD